MKMIKNKLKVNLTNKANVPILDLPKPDLQYKGLPTENNTIDNKFMFNKRKSI